MGTTYPCSLSLKKHIRIKHVRSANWVAPTCPQGCFLFFEGVSQSGGTNMPPRDVYYLFERVGDFPSSSQKVPIEFLLFPLISHQNLFVLIKFPKNSCQIPLVPINNPSKFFVPIKFQSSSFCSHQVLIKFLLFPSITHQYPFVLIKFPKTSHKFLMFLSSSHQIPFILVAMEDRLVSTKVNGEIHERLELSVK
jgi:hypothetical protein